MRLQLYSIEHAPASLPVWQALMADLGDPPPARVAKALGIGERTVYRYNSTGYAPKPVALAVFWLTRWGRSMVNAQATNDAIAACGFVASLRRRIEELEAQNAYLLSVGSFGSQNAPTVAPLRPSFLPASTLPRRVGRFTDGDRREIADGGGGQPCLKPNLSESFPVCYKKGGD